MKVVCEKCESSFKYEAVKDMRCCPVCGEPFEMEGGAADEPLSFGEGIELGENDSFDEDKIDFWWYSIREPGEVWKGITFADGDVSTNCAKCGHFTGCMPYPLARSGNYLLIDSRFHDRCSHCGNEMKNHILSKRPASWVDPRKREMLGSKTTLKCPICGSINVHRISLSNKAASAFVFGTLAAGHVAKTYQCDRSRAKF